MPANPTMTPAQQVATLRNQALLLEAQNRLLAAQQQAQKLAQAGAPADPALQGLPPAPKGPPAQIWHQDYPIQPYHSKLAHRNAFFASMNRAQTAFSMKYSTTAAGGVFTAVFPVELDRCFWICGALVSGFVTATQLAAGNNGWLNVRDNSTNNVFIQNLPLGITGQAAGPNQGQRVIWPMPYPIGAGGSFTAEVTVDPIAGAAASEYEVKFDGFWDFTHV